MSERTGHAPVEVDPEPVDPDLGAADDPGADPESSGGEGESAGTESVDFKALYEQTQSELRQVNERLGHMTDLVGSRYDRPNGASASQGSEDEPLPPELEPWVKELEVPEPHLRALRKTFRREGIQLATQVYQQQRSMEQLAGAFFARHKDLVGKEAFVASVAQQFMLDPTKHRGRHLLECLDDIAAAAKQGIGLPGKAPELRTTDSTRTAHAARGGTAGGSAGKETKPKPVPEDPTKAWGRGIRQRRSVALRPGGPLAGVKT